LRFLFLRFDCSAFYFFVMAGLVPAIHALSRRSKEGVDGREEPGHDEH
jgi:hypothetical protein